MLDKTNATQPPVFDRELMGENLYRVGGTGFGNLIEAVIFALQNNFVIVSDVDDIKNSRIVSLHEQKTFNGVVCYRFDVDGEHLILVVENGAVHYHVKYRDTDDVTKFNQTISDVKFPGIRHFVNLAYHRKQRISN